MLSRRPAPATDSETSSLIIATAVAATISTVLPGFLAGALSVQAIEEFGVTEAVYGWGLASFFLAASLASTAMGRVAQSVGPRRQVTVALLFSAIGSLVLAAFASSFVAFALVLGVLGFSNSANQSAINLLLAQTKIDRLGLAIAFKQSGMPMAALLGGLAVPAIAVTVGWRWVYVAAAIIPVVVLFAVRAVIEPVGKMQRAQIAEPITSRQSLKFGAVGFACLAFSAGALNAWTVGSAVDAGMSEGWAGLLLSAGAFVGVAVRIALGTKVDDTIFTPMKVASVLSAIGAIGVLGLAIRSPAVVVIATLVAFGAGWVWPVLTNFAIIHWNREAAAMATGITQTGVYVGVFTAPLVTGVVIDRFGFSTMWIMTAMIMLAGAAILQRVKV